MDYLAALNDAIRRAVLEHDDIAVVRQPGGAFAAASPAQWSSGRDVVVAVAYAHGRCVQYERTLRLYGLSPVPQEEGAERG
ncbi:MAG: hypothetical protein KGL39_20730 [Patescibacteria group bacterium]|nr:hypothetical protein [Patescibacteria group bacterium]